MAIEKFLVSHSNADNALKSWATKKSDVLPKNILLFLVKPSGKSLIYTETNKDDRIELCERPALISDRIDYRPLRATLCSLSFRNDCKEKFLPGKIRFSNSFV